MEQFPLLFKGEEESLFNCSYGIVTDMSMFAVSTEKEKALREKMGKLHIFEEDIEESFIRSGGKGGQHVNKVSTCVRLFHKPSGVEVKCQQERSQALNRYRARILLARKIEEMVLGALSEERKRIEKLKRQKRKRSRRAKEKILADKRAISEKKDWRAPVRDSGLT